MLHQLTTGVIEKIIFYLLASIVCAQCSPRHACPLDVSLLMQLHKWAQAAAGLARERILRTLKRMQNHAPDACMAI